MVLWTKADAKPHDVRGMLDAEKEASAEQVHGARTAIMRDAIENAPGADGLATDRSGLALSVRWADCQSFIVYAPEDHVLGVLHVGWRGLNAGAIPAFFATLKEEWDIEPQDTYVAAGPSLCAKCAEFSEPARELPSIDPMFFDGRHVDLRGPADAQLLALGIPRDHLERMADCTCCDPETYWTYRGGDREAVKAGERNLLACVLRPVLR